MNNKEWYEGDSWYTPQERQEEPAAPARSAPKKKKGWTPLRITGAVCILLALIVYFPMLVVFRAFNKEELLEMPMGLRLYRILHRLGML